MVQQQVGELRYGEDLDQIEEQLQGRGSLLPSVPGSQQPSVMGIVHHLPLSLSWLARRFGFAIMP